LHHTFRGHSTEIVCLSFNPQGTVVATGSMDNTARLWDVETGECLHTLLGHTAEVTSAREREVAMSVCKEERGKGRERRINRRHFKKKQF
jgi:hypothetical protein